MDLLELLARQLGSTAPRSAAGRERAVDEARRAAALGLRLVSLVDASYPEPLRRAPDPPLVLYLRGELEACCALPLVAIVGSRAASPRGKRLAFALGRDLAQAGVGVVSGLARGIDTAAHEGTLAAGGRTIAVQGRGLDGIYPPENAALAARLVQMGGALLSEFALGVGPRPGHFPRRNRILAGLVRAVVVVEAAEKSGALVTARLALDAGRDVLAVPGHPMDDWAKGTNALIKDGAGLVRDARDVLAEIGLHAKPMPAESSVDPVLAALPVDQPMTVEELARGSGTPVPALLARLTELEIAGHVLRLPGSVFVRSAPSGVR
ncbi:MAG TPA: DNA-processing protein DprA [Vicinamibacteria bacterium]|nr:DNA-processing protein DprA [Vicinamibacteria bacterium]